MTTLAQVGGIFSLLTFAHFVSDWLFQSHQEAMSKSTDGWARARHCMVYTALMIACVSVFSTSGEMLAWSAVLLFGSHFVEDTYAPVYIWVRYVRRPPGVTDLASFKAFAQTNLGLMLIIMADQLVHIVFLLLIAGMIAAPQITTILGSIGAFLVFILCVVTYLARTLK
jgi:hypothetical protein